MSLAPFPWDELVFSSVNSFGKERFDYFCAWPTYLGDPLILSFIAAAFILIWDDGKIGRKMTTTVLAIVLAFTLARLVKHAVFRPRPYEHYQKLIESGQYKINALFELLAHESSFPSGHTAVVFAMATALIGLYGRRFYWLYLFAGFIGFTRIYTGVHFPSDVLAGAAIGILAGRILLKFLPIGFSTKNAKMYSRSNG